MPDLDECENTGATGPGCDFQKWKIMVTGNGFPFPEKISNVKLFTNAIV